MMKIERKIQANYPLKNLNTFKIGGPAKFYLEVEEKDELVQAYDWADAKGLDVFLLGGGSNVLVPDQGIEGLVLRLNNNIVQLKGERIECGGGALLANINSKAMVQNLSGLEWSSGIPRATIGGAIRGNAGAFGDSVEDIVENVEAFYIPSRRFEMLSNRMCEFAYRNSLFKRSDRFVVWAAVLRMHKKSRRLIDEKIEHSLEHRKRCYPQLPSAGSVFENLDPEYVKSANKLLFERELKAKVGREGKLSAGLLIDMAGAKGKSIGGIKVSLEHANHIVNTGKGTAEEVVMMISYLKQQVRDRFGVQLREEVTYFGF